MNVHKLVKLAMSGALILLSTSVHAIDVASTAKALRLANTITGGLLPSSDPIFQQMVSKVAAGDLNGAAALASDSKYFANYLARRLALQMQNPSLDPSGVTDSDATAFLIAHFTGAGGTAPSLSSIWSEDATYLVNLNGTPTHSSSLTLAQLATVDWMSMLVKQPGQNARQPGAKASSIAIPSKHVGGYATLSDGTNDNSFAMWGATAGTNLRYIEGIWEISTGLELMDFASTNATVQEAPRFIPEYDPNFFHGQGQPACFACHGGGLQSLNHGYATVADTFNFDPAVGFTYIDAPTNATRKSLGSDAGKRNQTATCNLVANPTAVCNPDSKGIDPNQAWDVSVTWSQQGNLKLMGWTGPTSGQGLNELGKSIGQASIVYENFTKRVINEVCPMGIFSSAEVARIAASANPYASPKGTDDIRTIVNKVAVHPTCL